MPSRSPRTGGRISSRSRPRPRIRPSRRAGRERLRGRVHRVPAPGRPARRSSMRSSSSRSRSTTRDERGATPSERASSLRDRAEQLYVLGSLQTGNAEQVQRAERPDSPASPKPDPLDRPGRPVRRPARASAWCSCARASIAGSGRPRRWRRRSAGRCSRSSRWRRSSTGIPARRSRAEEAFSTLWTNLRYFNVTRKIDSVIVTSTRSGDGKTTVALNLATAAARTGSRVLLLEADLRRPSLWERVSPGQPLLGGLTQVLAGRRDLDGRHDQARTPRNARPRTATSGSWTSSSPDRFPRIRRRCSTQSRCESCSERRVSSTTSWSSTRRPRTVVPDAIPILQQVSAVLVVARAGTTTRDEAAELSSQLKLLDAPLVGVVANYAADADHGLWLLLLRRGVEASASQARGGPHRGAQLGPRLFGRQPRQRAAVDDQLLARDEPRLARGR